MKLALLTIAASLVATAAAAQSCPYGYFNAGGYCQSIQNPTQGNPNYDPHPGAVGAQQGGGIYNPYPQQSTGGGINPHGQYQQVNPNRPPVYVVRVLPDGRLVQVPIR